MATRTPTRRLLNLRESGALEFAPAQTRVDRDKGIIYGVKVLGETSPNTHKSGATKGTKYTPSARAGLARVLEGLHVNVDHQSRANPNEERKARDGLGELRNARELPDGVYADLHCLTAHPMWEPLAEAAEKMPGAFALSINAQGRGEVADGYYVVQEVARVQSVDLVRDGGSCRTLFESEERKIATLPLRNLLESRVLPAIRAGRAKRLKNLLAAAPTVLLREAEDQGETADYRDHLHQARKICEDAGDMETAGKIHNMMKPAKVEESEEEVDAEESPKGETTGGGDNSDKDKKARADAAKAVAESRARVTRLAKGFLQLQESQQPPEKLVEALVALPTEEARLNLLESWPRGTPAPERDRGRSPVGVGPGGQTPAGGNKLTLKDVRRSIGG